MERFHLGVLVKIPVKGIPIPRLSTPFCLYPRSLNGLQCNSDMMEIAKRWNFHLGQRTEECYSSFSNPGTGKPPLGGRRDFEREEREQGKGRQRLRWWKARPPAVHSWHLCPRWLCPCFWKIIVTGAHIWRAPHRLWRPFTVICNQTRTAKWAEQTSLALVTSDSPKVVTCPCLDSSDNSDDNGSKENQCFESTRHRPGPGLCVCLHSIHYWASMEFLQDGFYPHFPDKENESHQGLAVGPRSHRKPVAEPRFKSRQFASKIYVLSHYSMPACLSKQGRETGLTPNFTSMLVALYKEKSASLVGDIHSFTQICAGQL